MLSKREKKSKFMPPAARGALLKNRPPGPPTKLLIKQKFLRTFRGPGGSFFKKRPLAAGGIFD
jgi:hypothetical protein